MHATRKKKENENCRKHGKTSDFADGTMIYSCCVDAIKCTKKTKMEVFLSSALKCVGFSIGQQRINQGNQIHGFGCPAFEIGTTWIFFNFEHWLRENLYLFHKLAILLSVELDNDTPYTYKSCDYRAQKKHCPITWDKYILFLGK